MGNRSAVGLLFLVLFTVPAAAQIEGDTWFPIGPAPISGFFKGGGTGRASAIAVNPMNKDEVWLGTAAGGVWHTRDAGANWEPMSDREDGLAIGAMALDGCTASGCTRIFAGTGENAIRRDTYHGHGLLIGTTSGGEFPTFSWQHVTGSPFDWRFTSINNIVFDPNSNAPNKPIYVTVSSGVTVAAPESTVTVPTAASVFGIYRSTNGGTTWEKLNVPGADARPTDLKMHPSNPMILYAGFLGRGVFRTTDGGTSWCPMNQGVPSQPGCPVQDLPNVSLPFDHVAIAFSPSATDTLYATFGRCADRLIQNCVPAIWKTTNGGMDWSETNPGNASDGGSTARSYSRYTHALAVDPATPSTILLGGVDLARSTNSGASFTASHANNAPGGGIATLHSDHRDVVFAPSDPSRVYDTNDGGFAVSFDGGNTWTPRNDDLQVTAFQGLGHSILPTVGMVIGASQDNAAQTWNGGRVWTHRSGGDGGYAMMDWDTSMVMYEGSNWGAMNRSTDGGVGFGAITPSNSDPRLFYAPFAQGWTAVGPEHPIYWGSNRLWRSVNNGTNWTDVSPVLAAGAFSEIVTAPNESTHLANPAGGVNVITAIGIAPNNANRIYIGYYGGEIFATSNNPNAPCAMNNCWDATDTEPPNAPVTRIAVDPTNADIAYATFSGFGNAAKVWKTTNRGADWVPMASGLPPGIPANTISIEPATASTPQRIYVGMDSGPDGSSMFRSTNGGATWTAFSNGLPNVPIYEISIDTVHGRIYAATHGRGAWVLGRAFISNYEGWVNGSIWDIPVFGQNFLPNQGSCTMQILQTNGSVCASSTIDQMGGTIRTDSGGVLETSLASMWNGRRVAWACFNGNCIDNTPIAECNDDADGDGDIDPLSTIVVSCGGHIAIGTVTGAPPLDNPPDTLLGLGLLGIPTMFIAASEVTAEAAMPRRAAAAAGVLHLTTIIQRPVGTQSLCTVAVPFAADDSDLVILERAQNAVNASPTCAANRVQAILDRGLGGESEDEFAQPPRLRLRAPGVTGSQLISGIHVQPGSGTGSCFQISGIGVPVLNQTQVLKISMVTPPGGAAGGNVTITEESPVGACEIMVPTFAGQTRDQLANAVVAAFQAPGIPGPHPRCPADRNLRDASVIAGGVVTVFASMLQVCTTDPNIGFDIRPKELLNVHPVAEAGDDRVAPAGMPVALTAAASFDADSTPGTRDDIASYQWFDVTSGPPVLLGSTEMLSIPLANGIHRLRLRVTDKAGLADTDETVVDVGGTAGGGSGGRWLGSFHVGSTHPLGDLASVSDANIHLRADIGYRLTRRARLLAFGGFSQLTAETAAAIPHPRFINLSLNGQWLVPLASGTDFYLEGGPGAYWRKSGGSNFGFNLGLGFQLPFSANYRLELGADYHRVSGPRTQFVTVQLGVLFR